MFCRNPGKCASDRDDCVWCLVGKRSLFSGLPKGPVDEDLEKRRSKVKISGIASQWSAISHSAAERNHQGDGRGTLPAEGGHRVLSD